ncbi:MAG: hypothetical protein V3U30_05040 [Thermoplasmata archaeon]
MASLKELSVSDVLGEGPDGSDRKGGGVRSLVLSYVRRNFEGITTKMVADAADISESRAWQILKGLSQEREIYERKVPGVQAHMFYPNGQLIHKYLQQKRDLGPQIFRISIHEGRREPRVQIQERSFTLLDGEKVEGSIFVDLSHARELAGFISDMLAKFDGYEKSKELRRR